MSEIELTSVVPSSDAYISLIREKFGQHTQIDLVTSLKRNYNSLSEDRKKQLIEALKLLDNVEEDQAKMPFGGKSRRKRHKKKTHRNKSKRKR